MYFSGGLVQDLLGNLVQPNGARVLEVRPRAGTIAESLRRLYNASVYRAIGLSGGVDSSALVALAAECTSHRLKTFSVGFADREANEFSYARRVAGDYGTDHHEIALSPTDFFHALPHLIWHILWMTRIFNNRSRLRPSSLGSWRRNQCGNAAKINGCLWSCGGSSREHQL